MIPQSSARLVVSAELPLPPAARLASSSFWSAGALALTADAASSVPKRVKFFIRAWMQRKFTRAWLARLVQPDLAPLWSLRPRLATKLQRPYICCAWNTPVRCAALLGHYDRFPRLFAPAARAAIFGRGLVVLTLMNEATNRRLDLRLLYHDRFEKEGELTLALCDTDTGLLLAGLTFCLARQGDHTLAVIGGLQAGNDPRIRNLIRDVAREMHGLRPKAFLVWCLQQLAEPWGLIQIQAIGDASHVWRHWRKRLDIAACYDEFWAECGGTELPGGGSWDLPLQTRIRAREDLKASRRKAHEKRYALLDGLHPKLRAAFAAVAPGQDIHGRPEEFTWSFPVSPAGRTQVETRAMAALNHSY